MLHLYRHTAYCRRDQSSGLKGRDRQSVRTEPLSSFHKKKGWTRNFVIKVEETENLYMAFLEDTPTVGSIIGIWNRELCKYGSSSSMSVTTFDYIKYVKRVHRACFEKKMLEPDYLFWSVTKFERNAAINGDVSVK